MDLRVHGALKLMPGRHQELSRLISACRRCSRLGRYQEQQKLIFPEYHCAPVPQWGVRRSRLLIVGLAPGLHGAGRTGKGFVGDASGAFLFQTLHRFGYATSANPEVSALRKTAITNIVKCLPPSNQPSTQEKNNCSPFLQQELELFAPGPRARFRVLLCLGSEAFYSVQRSMGLQTVRFAHGQQVSLAKNYSLFSSYHPSRLNVNTGRLTQEMFDAVFAEIRTALN